MYSRTARRASARVGHQKASEFVATAEWAPKSLADNADVLGRNVRLTLLVRRTGRARAFPAIGGRLNMRAMVAGVREPSLLSRCPSRPRCCCFWLDDPATTTLASSTTAAGLSHRPRSHGGARTRRGGRESCPRPHQHNDAAVVSESEEIAHRRSKGCRLSLSRNPVANRSIEWARDVEQ